MDIENKTKSVLNVCKFLVVNNGRWISDYEISEITKRYEEEIVDELIAYKVVISTKDGILYEKENVDAMKRYLRKYGVNI
jgi:hypothetical protein